MTTGHIVLLDFQYYKTTLNTNCFGYFY